ncbi:hypothetical protein KI387_024062, partial [Taxus chinensis]
TRDDDVKDDSAFNPLQQRRMVARSPPKDARPAFDQTCHQSLLLKQTVNKVDRAMARLQELQSTVRGHKVCSGVTTSPRSARGYVRTNLRCKQESLRIQETEQSVTGGSTGAEANKCCQPLGLAEIGSYIAPGEWRRWSLPAALVQQAILEIVEASTFAKGVVTLFSDSISNKLVQDPKTPQRSFNGVNLLEERKQKDIQVDRKVASVHRKNCRYNYAQRFRKLNHKRVTVDNTEHWSIKAAESILKTPPGKHQSLISCLQNEGLDGKCFLVGNTDKKPTYRNGQKVVHKFRMITPENKVKTLSSQAASSSLELRRRAEKQQPHARARAELSLASARVQSQMNFPTKCANECGKNVKAVASALVSCCSSPVKSIGEQKPLMKVDQITPTRKPWSVRPNLTKAIMFPNPSFVPSPSDFRNNYGKISYQQGFDIPKLKQSPLSKSTHKPFSNLNTPKVKECSSLPKVPIRTPIKKPIRMIKQTPVVKASTSSYPARSTPSFANQRTPRKFPKLSPSKNKSPKHCSSSKKPVWFHRNIALRSGSSPVTCNISLLSKQMMHSPVQPLPSLISKLPSRRKRSSSPMPNAHVEESVPNRTAETKGSVSGRVLPLPPARVATLPVVCMKPSNPKYADLSVDEMPYKSSVLDRDCSISCPKQRTLKPIENITNFSGMGNRITNVSASNAELSMRRKDQQSEGKENKIESDEDGYNTILEKPNTALRRSWSVGHENATLIRNRKLNNSA